MWASMADSNDRCQLRFCPARHRVQPNEDLESVAVVFACAWVDAVQHADNEGDPADGSDETRLPAQLFADTGPGTFNKKLTVLSCSLPYNQPRDMQNVMNGAAVLMTGNTRRGRGLNSHGIPRDGHLCLWIQAYLHGFRRVVLTSAHSSPCVSSTARRLLNPFARAFHYAVSLSVSTSDVGGL